jgi:hypothetical protein
MGSLKDEMMDREQERIDKQYAKALNITYDEYLLLDLHGVDDSDNNGTLLLRFEESSSPEVLKKIGADNTRSVRINESDLY